MNDIERHTRASRRVRAAWTIVGLGIAVQLLPPLAAIFISVARGLDHIPKANGAIVGLTIAVAAMSWCYAASHWWRGWVINLNVDRMAVERLARRTGLIWGPRPV
jgi:hypothetical protein